MIKVRLTEQLQLLPDYLGNHIMLTVVALATGIIICLPLAVYVTRVRLLQWPTLTFASVMQTIPGNRTQQESLSGTTRRRRQAYTCAEE